MCALSIKSIFNAVFFPLYFFAASLLLFSPFVQSAEITVTSTEDVLDGSDGVCTLREAVIAANENFWSGPETGECISGDIGADTITLWIPGIYSFSLPGTGEDAARTGDLDLLEDVTIQGSDATRYVINAAHLSRVIQIPTGVSVTLNDLTITGGREPTNFGGGINNRGDLVIEDAVISGNVILDAGDGGGGIAQPAGSLLVRRTLFKNNQTANNGLGGAIWLGAGTVMLEDCVLEGNIAENGGAILLATAASLNVVDSLFSANIADAKGGAIRNYSTNVTVIGSTFTGNTANNGGAIFTTTDPLSVSNSTFHGNTALNQGAGLYVESGNISLRHITFDEGFDISGSAVYYAGGTVTAENTLVFGRCDGKLLTSYGGNIETPGNTCGFTELTDQSATSPVAVNLQPLQDNGGPTPTQLPGIGSIALENATGIGCLVDDQRAVPRPQDFDGLNNAECDVGAVELIPCEHDSVLVLDDNTTWVFPVFEACERINAGNGFTVTERDSIMRAGDSVAFNSNFRVTEGASLSVNVDWAFWEGIP